MLPRYYHCRKMVQHVGVPPGTSHFLPTRSKQVTRASSSSSAETHDGTFSCVMRNDKSFVLPFVTVGDTASNIDPMEQTVSRRS